MAVPLPFFLQSRLLPTALGRLHQSLLADCKEKAQKNEVRIQVFGVEIWVGRPEFDILGVEIWVG